MRRCGQAVYSGVGGGSRWRWIRADVGAVSPCVGSLTALELRRRSCGAGGAGGMAGVVRGGPVWRRWDASPACVAAFTRAPRRWVGVCV